MPPKVSICVPTYKQTEYLKKTLDSIVFQTFTDYEIIITDDTPGDSVEKLVDEYKNKFGPKLQYYKNSPPLGSPENWNESIRHASGQWIKIMHHDDWFADPHGLQKFIDAAAKSKNDFIFSEAYSYNVKNNSTHIHRPPPDFLENLKKEPEILFLGNLIGPPSSVFYKRNLNILFDKKLKLVVDFSFYIEALHKTDLNYYYINEPLIVSTNHASHNVTNYCDVPEIELFEYFYLYDKIHSHIKNKRKYEDLLTSLLVKHKVTNLKSFLSYYPNVKQLANAKKLLKKALLLSMYSKIRKIIK